MLEFNVAVGCCERSSRTPVVPSSVNSGVDGVESGPGNVVV